MGQLWSMLLQGISALLSYLYELTVTMGIPSYALAIIFLTLIIKIITFPLNNKQMKSMKKMQEVQPLIQEVQKKYKKSPEKANQKVMEIYKEYKVNPMSGCLPLVIQMPILFALFRTLQSFQYNDLGSGFLWVEHLMNPDPIIIPIIVALTTFLQSKVSTPSTAGNSAGASTQKTMLYFMPLMIGYMSTRFPAGLSLYWIFNNVFGVLQQLLINRKPTLAKGEIEEK